MRGVSAVRQKANQRSALRVGRPWPAILIMTLAGCARPIEVPYPTDGHADFAAVWTVIEDHYALFECKGVDPKLLRALFEPRFQRLADRAAVHGVLEEMADVLDDIHLTIRDDRTGRQSRSGDRSVGTGPFDDGTFSETLIEANYLTSPLEPLAAETLGAGWLPGNIAYLRVRRLGYPTTTRAALRGWLPTVAGADAVVVDLRHNGGGDDEAGRALLGAFANTERPYLTRRAPVGNRRTGAGSWTTAERLTLQPMTNAYLGPVIVLSDSRTISAAENALLGFKELAHATLVGELSAGAMADAVPIVAERDWTVSVAINEIRDAHGTCWEGIGVQPHFHSSNPENSVALGKDMTLETAILMSMGQSR